MPQASVTVLQSTVSSGSEEFRMPLTAGQIQHFDHIFRITTDLYTQTLVARSWQTGEVEARISAWVDEKLSDSRLLCSFAVWQKKKLDYNGVYAAYLLDGMTEEEFVEEAQKYAKELEVRDPCFIVEVTEKLMRLLPFELTTADIADFLNTEPRLVLAAISSAVNPSSKLRALLPVALPDWGK